MKQGLLVLASIGLLSACSNTHPTDYLRATNAQSLSLPSSVSSASIKHHFDLPATGPTTSPPGVVPPGLPKK